jgi:hypothetical protein
MSSEVVTDRVDYPALYLQRMRTILRSVDSHLAEIERGLPYCDIAERRKLMSDLRAHFDDVSAAILDASEIVGDHIVGLDSYLAKANGQAKPSR